LYSKLVGVSFYKVLRPERGCQGGIRWIKYTVVVIIETFAIQRLGVHDYIAPHLAIDRVIRRGIVPSASAEPDVWYGIHLHATMGIVIVHLRQVDIHEKAIHCDSIGREIV
jgi:hypothetical protein